MNGPDAIYARFADAVVLAAKLPELRQALTKVRPGATEAEVSKIINSLATGETAGPVAARKTTIDALFAFERVGDIVAALKRDGSDFAQSTLETRPRMAFSRWMRRSLAAPEEPRRRR